MRDWKRKKKKKNVHTGVLQSTFDLTWVEYDFRLFNNANISIAIVTE